MNDKYENLEQRLSDVDFDDAPDHAHRDLLEQKLLLNFNASGTRQNVKWRTIMNNKITKTAVAAIMVVAVMAGLSIIGGTSSVALAHVLDKIMEVRTYAYRMRTTSEETADYSEMQLLTSKDYGMVTNFYVSAPETGQIELFVTNYTDLSEGIITSVVHLNKSVIEIDITEEVLAGMEKESGDPAFFIREFVKQPYIELGEDTIDGIDVVVFESTDIADTQGRSVARLWVDIATELPVKIETVFFDEDDSLISQITIYDFDWNPQVTEADFVAVIPDGFENRDIGKVEFTGDVNSIIKALAFYAKFFDGKYPESLAVKNLTLSNQVEAALRSGAAQMYAGKSEQEIMQDVGQGFMNLEFSVTYYGILASENKAIAYYGDQVTADNPDAVLMRWRQDDGRYMVIFGDLTTKQVTEEALAELEAMPIK